MCSICMCVCARVSEGVCAHAYCVPVLVEERSNLGVFLCGLIFEAGSFIECEAGP